VQDQPTKWYPNDGFKGTQHKNDKNLIGRSVLKRVIKLNVE
jgi:hypothetical protein